MTVVRRVCQTTILYVWGKKLSYGGRRPLIESNGRRERLERGKKKGDAPTWNRLPCFAHCRSVLDVGNTDWAGERVLSVESRGCPQAHLVTWTMDMDSIVASYTHAHTHTYTDSCS